MSNNKQSSIELFIEQLEEKGNAYEEAVGVRTVNICIDVSDYMELKQQAKAMHKEQCVDFAEKAVRMVLDEDVQNPVSINQLYNETFNK
jgi:LmbE family N-acetylglucosaminyl deacetylase